KTSFQQIDKWNKQREKVETLKENTALDHEIAGAKERIEGFENEILETMGQVEDKTAQLPAVEKKTQTVRTQGADFKKDYEQRIDQWTADKQKTSGELAEVEKGIPDDIRETYQKMVKHMGVEALSGTEGRTCLACRTDVTSQMEGLLLRGAFVICKSCG